MVYVVVHPAHRVVYVLLGVGPKGEEAGDVLAQP